MNVITAPMSLRPYEDRDAEAYEAFLRSVDGGLLYYTPKYRQALVDILGCTASYWLAISPRGIEGVLPLMEREGCYGRVWNGLPFYGSNGAPLARTATAYEQLIQQYDALVSQPDVAAATIIENPYAAPIYAEPPHHIVDERIAQATPLPREASEDALLKIISSSARRNIVKAAKSGVRVEVDNSAISFLERVHCENMAEIGGTAKTAAFFSVFPKHFVVNKDYRIYVASIDREPVAAMLLFYFGSTVEYFMPVTQRAYRDAQPTALILRDAMLDAARRGFRWWNWGGTWLSQVGVWRFKKKWGAIDRRYRYLVTVNTPDVYTASSTELLREYPGFFVIPFDRLVVGSPG